MQCQCGHESAPGANFCSCCGARLSKSGGARVTLSKRGNVPIRQAAEQARRVGKAAVGAVAEGLRSDIGKSVAAGAALGALIAVPIPFVGPALGAAVGAAMGAFRKF